MTGTWLNPYQTTNSDNRSNSQQLKSRCLWLCNGAKDAEIRFITNSSTMRIVFFTEHFATQRLDLPLPLPVAIQTSVIFSVREGKWSHATKDNYFKFVAKWFLVKPVWWTTEHSVHYLSSSLTFPSFKQYCRKSKIHRAVLQKLQRQPYCLQEKGLWRLLLMEHGTLQ